MKHEKFKAFASQTEADAFLASADINAKSISYINEEGAEALIIGYTESSKTHHYRVEQEAIDNVMFKGLENMMGEVEEMAEKHNGVICQDMHIMENTLVIFFLVATEQ